MLCSVRATKFEHAAPVQSCSLARTCSLIFSDSRSVPSSLRVAEAERCRSSQTRRIFEFYSRPCEFSQPLVQMIDSMLTIAVESRASLRQLLSSEWVCSVGVAHGLLHGAAPTDVRFGEPSSSTPLPLQILEVHAHTHHQAMQLHEQTLSQLPDPSATLPTVHMQQGESDHTHDLQAEQAREHASSTDEAMGRAESDDESSQSDFPSAVAYRSANFITTDNEEAMASATPTLQPPPLARFHAQL